METKAQKSVISVLFELCRQRKLTPLIEEVGCERRPNNEVLFAMRVSAGDFIGLGYGKNRKVAKARASFQLLQKVIHSDVYKSWGIPGDTKEEALQYLGTLNCGTEKDAIDQSSTGKAAPGPNSTPVAVLNELCMKRGYSLPRYEDAFLNMPDISVRNESDGNGRAFFIRAVLGSLERIGNGSTKREARQAAAALVLQALSSIQDLDISSEFPLEEELGLDTCEEDGEAQMPEEEPALMDSQIANATLETLKTMDLDNMPTGFCYADLLYQLLPRDVVPVTFHYVEREGEYLVELTVSHKKDRKDVVYARAESLQAAMNGASLKFLRSLQLSLVRDGP